MWTIESLKIVGYVVDAIRITSRAPFNIFLTCTCSLSLFSSKLKGFITDLGFGNLMKLAPHDTEQFKEVRDKDKPGRDREQAQFVEARPSGTEATGKCAGFPSGT